MNLKVQRFQPGHEFYSNAAIKHDERRYVAVFGQMVLGDKILYTMERLDTLIPEGTYEYSFYYSPSNKCTVLLLHNVPGFNMIEIHVANWPYEIKGCTSVGLAINTSVPMLTSSGKAFNELIHGIKEAHPDAKVSKVDKDFKPYEGDILGTITYEKFEDQYAKSII